MGAITDLWKSERGVVAIAMLILVTVAFCLGNITAVDWQEMLKWIFVTYTGAKTATSVVEALKAPAPAQGPAGMSAEDFAALVKKASQPETPSAGGV